MWELHRWNTFPELHVFPETLSDTKNFSSRNFKHHELNGFPYMAQEAVLYIASIFPGDVLPIQTISPVSIRGATASGLGQ